VRIVLPLSLLLLPLVPACSTPSPSPNPAVVVAPSLRADELEARIAQGRALLDAGQVTEAQRVFDAAAQADGDSLRSRMWVLRAWMEQGRNNDTLDALDALDRAGTKGPDMTYLYGMAFARRAQGYVAEGVADSSVQMNFLDATTFLKQAVEADASRYRDAFLPLANSAWYVQDLDTARWAADRAVKAYPESSAAWSERGRIAMAQFLAAQGEEPEGAKAEALWNDTADSFQRAVALYGAPTSEAEQSGLATAATQLGHAMMWKKKGADATDAYATAIAYDPQSFNYNQCFQLLSGAIKAPEDERPCGFRPTLELAHERFAQHASAGDPRGSTLSWWLGWARFNDADWSGAEEGFLGAAESANSWFYIGLARHYRHDSAGGVEAMRKGWDLDPTSMISEAASAGGALRAFEGLIAWCANEEPARNLDAAFLSELLAQAFPANPRYWNNVGLFLRDEGENLEIDAHKNKTAKPSEAVLSDLYNRSYKAYQRALELDPADPQLQNDAALMLHYHFESNTAEVEALYRHALELVEVKLAATDLSADDRARFEQTKKDIDTNLRHLLDPESEKKDAEDAAEASASGGK